MNIVVKLGNFDGAGREGESIMEVPSDWPKWSPERRRKWVDKQVGARGWRSYTAHQEDLSPAAPSLIEAPDTEGCPPCC